MILLTLPSALIGITAGLLVFDKAFGFVAILGVLSLSGIMIRNSVVLLETIDKQVEAGKTRYRAGLSPGPGRFLAGTPRVPGIAERSPRLTCWVRIRRMRRTVVVPLSRQTPGASNEETWE